MAGINLIKELDRARKESGSPENSSAPLAGEGLPGLWERIKGGADGFSRDDYIALAKFVLGLALVFGGKFYVENIWNAEEQALLQSNLSKLTQQVAQEKAKLNKYKLLIKEIEEADKRIADIRKKLETLASVLKNRNIAVKMIDFIVKEMPEAVWLEDIDLNPAPPDQRIKIKGFAANLQNVGDFIKNLEGAVFFPSWSLIEGRDDPTALTAPSTAPPDPNSNKRERPPGTKEYRIEAKVVI